MMPRYPTRPLLPTEGRAPSRPPSPLPDARKIRDLAGRAYAIIGAVHPRLNELAKIIPEICDELLKADPADQVLNQFATGVARVSMDMSGLGVLRDICRSASRYGITAPQQPTTCETRGER